MGGTELTVASVQRANKVDNVEADMAKFSGVSNSEKKDAEKSVKESQEGNGDGKITIEMWK